MSRVRLVNLVKKYGSNTAVKGVNLDINSGEFVVLLGPSGCGKTTTLRCIAGLENPDEGDVYIDEVHANQLAPKDRDVAMVFQNYALYPHMSIFDNIAFPLKRRKKPKDEIKRSVEEVAKLLNIGHLLSRKPRQLSGGEQQRAALARAIVRRPKVFLMDEPLSNLDAKLRLYTRTEIKRLQDELKVTTIYVTHDQAEALSMADKVAVMDNGQLVQYAAPFEIYEKPATTFVAGFVGSPPMNLIKASVVNGDSATVLDTGLFRYQPPRSITDALKSRTVSEVILGIRPEDLKLTPSKLSDSVFETEIYVVEPLGANTVVDIKLGSVVLKSMVQGAFDTPPGRKMWAGFLPEKLHVFDGRTENLIV